MQRKSGPLKAVAEFEHFKRFHTISIFKGLMVLKVQVFSTGLVLKEVNRCNSLIRSRVTVAFKFFLDCCPPGTLGTSGFLTQPHYAIREFTLMRKTGPGLTFKFGVKTSTEPGTQKKQSYTLVFLFFRR